MKTEHTPTPWKYSLNVGPTKALIVENDGSTVIELLNRLRSSKFEANVEFIVRAVNSHDEMLEALYQNMEILEQLRLRIELEIKDKGEDAIFPCRAMLGSSCDALHVIRDAIASAEGKVTP